MVKVLRNGKKINKKAESAIEEVERDMAKEGRLTMIESSISVMYEKSSLKPQAPI